MQSFKMLYLYEMKKILMRKIVWIATGIMLAATVYMVLSRMAGDYYVDGEVIGSNYEMFLTDREYARALNGRLIDEGLLKNMQEAYAKVPDVKQKHYSMTEEYQQYARPYSEIHNFVLDILKSTGSGDELLTIDAEGLYQKRQELLREIRQEFRLTQGETAYWQEQENKLEKPFVYSYHDGYERSVVYLYSLNMLLLLLITVCLSPVFTDEHSRRTDQLILSSRYGRKLLYRAKMAAGISFAEAEVLLFSAAFTLLTFFMYGTDGFDAPVQLKYLTSQQMTMGELVILMYGLLLIVGILYSVMVMVISELCRSNVATIGIMIVFLILSVFMNIPEQYRIAGQLVDMLPMQLVTWWGVSDMRLVPIPGGYMTTWQVAVLLYAVAAVCLIMLGKRCYSRYEISDR